MDERYTVAGLLRTQADKTPGETMLVCGDERRSWADQHRRSSQVAQALRAEGVSPGDRIAFLDRNGLDYFDVLFGGAFAGAVNVAVNWRLAPVEMAAVIDDSRAKVLFVHPEYQGAVQGLQLPHVRQVVVLGDGPDSSEHSVSSVGYGEWLGGHPATDPGFAGGPDHVAMQLYTSGTTGLPKGVMLSNANLATAIGEAAGTFNVDDATVSLVAMPLFHIGGSGWALCGMSRGGRSVVLRDVNPAEILRLVEAERITDSFLVPAVLMLLLLTPGVDTTDLSSLRNVFYGASPISEEVLVKCMSVFDCAFTQVYGMTETTGAITALRPEDHDPDGSRRHLLRSAGKPHPHVELRIAGADGADGADAPVGVVGELLVRSPYNMPGYFGKPDETSRTIDENGWLHTGDAGYLDDEGYLFLHDRIKDMIVSGGENVYPAEVENVLAGHPAVADVAVIGVPDERWGEAVKALVVATAGAEPDEAKLIAFCRSRLAGYKCPKSVDVVETLPRTPSGKVLKRELRASYWEGTGRGIN